MGTFKIFKTVMRSLFKKPATRNYPAEPRQWEEITRGHISITAEDCILCSICAKKCPTDAIAVDKAERTWTIERMLCIQCSHCVEVCPKKCLRMEPEYTSPDTEKVIDTVGIPEKVKAEKPESAEAA